ncbi:MAG: formylglycine-generating enzyme family protein [Deltaproteobacteria bacterium]|nr:formylglycine-generating enzyme family protein [Deltaproteobacteria bacterium]
MRFTLIPAGSFLMGAGVTVNRGVTPRYGNNESPRHMVTITTPFYIGVYEVTQEEWIRVMKGSSPSYFKGRRLPVEQVSMVGARAFLRKLNQLEGTEKYRLPTEAEWEYSARAGASSEYFFGDDSGALENYAWFRDNGGGKTRPVGEKTPNPWGLYDIYGNVMEWVSDLYGDYLGPPETDPKGPTAISYHTYVFRGCSWSHEASYCRSAKREWAMPWFERKFLGFRVAFSAGNYGQARGKRTSFRH